MMASDRDLEGFSRILKLSLDAAMAGRTKPHTSNVSVHDGSQAESTSNMQEAVVIDNISTQHSHGNGVYSCVQEDVYKYGRGRGRSRGQESNKHSFLQQKQQEFKVSNCCSIQCTDSFSVTDPLVCTEETESIKTTRDVSTPTSVKSHDHCEEKCKDKTLSRKTDTERVSVKHLSIFELPDLVKCQVSPEEITQMPIAEKPISGMRQLSALNELSLSDHPKKATSTEAASSSSLSVAASGTNTSSSLVTRKGRSGFQRKHAQVYSQSIESRTGKQTPAYNLSMGKIQGQAFQENVSRHRDDQLATCVKTGADYRTTNVSKSADKSAFENQRETVARKGRSFKKCKETCSVERNAFRYQLPDSSRKNAGHKVDEVSNRAASTLRAHVAHKMSTGDHNRVSKHLEQPAAPLTDEMKAAATASCQNGKELGKCEVMQSLPEQSDHMMTFSLGIIKDSAGQLEQDNLTACESGSFHPSLYEMISAIYQSYERTMTPDDDRPPETIEACQLSLTSDLCSKSSSDFASSACSKVDGARQGAVCSQSVSRKYSLRRNILKTKSSSNSDSHSNSYPRSYISSWEVSVPAEGWSEVMSVHHKGQTEVMSVHNKDQTEVMSVPTKDQYEVFVPTKDQSEVSVLTKDQSDVSVPNKDQSEVSVLIKDRSDVSVPTKDQAEVSVPIKDHSEMSVPTKDHSEMSVPTKDQAEVSVPIKDHSEMSVPTKDHSEVSIPIKDHSEMSVPTKDHSEMSVPTKDHSEVSVPTKDQAEVSVPTKGQAEVSVPTKDQAEVSVPTKDQAEVSVPTKDQSEVAVPTKDQSEVISLSAGIQSEISFPCGVEPVKVMVPPIGHCDEVSVVPEVDCDETIVRAEAHTSRPFTEPNASRKSSDKVQLCSTPHCIPSFQTRELNLPAETVGSRLTTERMFAFVKSCCTDIEKHMERYNQDQPADVTIRMSLTNPLLSDYLPRHSHNNSSSQTERVRPHYYASPFMFQPPNLLSTPPPPYWYWGPWSEWYSPSVDCTPNSDLLSLNVWYPGMMHQQPSQDNCDRWMPAPGYPNTCMCSSQSSPQFDYKQHGPDGTYACRQSSSQAWPREDMPTDYDNNSPMVDSHCYSYRQFDPDTAEQENRDCSEMCSAQFHESSNLPETNKWPHNNAINSRDTTNTWKDMNTVKTPVPQSRSSQKADDSIKYMHPAPVSSFLTADLLDNNWNVRTPSPASNSFRKHLASKAACPSTSVGPSLASVNIQSDKNADSPLLDPARKSGFVSKVVKKSWIEQNNYEAVTRRQGYTPADGFKRSPCQSDSQAWTRQGYTAADGFKRGPCQSDSQAWTRHSFPHKKRHWIGNSMANPPNTDYEVQSQASQVKRRLSTSEGQTELHVSSFWHSPGIQEDGALAQQMATVTPLQAGKDTNSKRWALARECASLLMDRSRAYKYTFVDCHCHIDFLYSRLEVPRGLAFSQFIEDYVGSFPHNYEGCVAVFCQPSTFTAKNPKDQILKTISAEAGVWLAVGCHPKNAVEFENSHVTGLRQILQHPKVVALGEIGLDYSSGFVQHSERQKQVFTQQLHLALEMRLPLVIHCRDADDDCLEILVQFEKGQGYLVGCTTMYVDFIDSSAIKKDIERPRKDCLGRVASPGVVAHMCLGRVLNGVEQEVLLSKIVPRDHKIHAHCFTKDITVARRWMEAFPNLFLGLTPLITYKSAVGAANTARHIPLDRLLLETDAPYFVPGSLRNGPLGVSHPGLALCTAEKVAELRNIPVDEVLRACRENTYKMYGI